MQSSSAIINKALRRQLSPVVRAAGFQQVDARNAWAWHDYCILVLNVRAVGNYFAKVTGWSPASVAVWLGVFYTFVPSLSTKISKTGVLLPAEYQCHMRTHLECSYPQYSYTTRLHNPAEQERKDIWWLHSDGSNADQVSSDIAYQFQNIALKWFERCMNLNTAFSEVEEEHDCFNKYVLAAILASKLNNTDLKDKYTYLAEEEGKRIGITPDPKKWFVLSGR